MITKTLHAIGLAITVSMTVSLYMDGIESAWTWALLAVCNAYMAIANARVHGLLGERTGKIHDIFHAAFPFIILVIAIGLARTEGAI